MSTPAKRPDPDRLLVEIAEYALDYRVDSALAYETARGCLMDALACGFLALQHPACAKLLGPVVPGATMMGGARVPGTSYELDPVKAAFDIGTMVRWLDVDDTPLEAGWGHPCDNLGGILAAADWLARRSVATAEPAPTVRDVLTAMIKAHEMQGVIARDNPLEALGYDRVLYVRIATTAVVTAMLGGTREQVIAAVSNAFLDGAALGTCRHAPDACSRRRWAAGDATACGVRHALLALAGEQGCPSALTGPTRGFHDVLLGKPFAQRQPFGSHVMEHAPIGHRRQRAEALPLLVEKFHDAVAGHFAPRQRDRLKALFADPGKLDAMPVHEFVSATVRNH